MHELQPVVPTDVRNHVKTHDNELHHYNSVT